jgi:hypothetical protein
MEPKLLRKPPTASDSDTKTAIQAVNNVIVTVEKTGQVSGKKETFITQKGGKMYSFCSLSHI